MTEYENIVIGKSSIPALFITQVLAHTFLLEEFTAKFLIGCARI